MPVNRTFDTNTIHHAACLHSTIYREFTVYKRYINTYHVSYLACVHMHTERKLHIHVATYMSVEDIRIVEMVCIYIGHICLFTY